MLYKEGLLTSLAWTASSGEMKQIVTPSDNIAKCGIFLGHLTLTVATNSPLLEQYVPLKTWGNVVRHDTVCKKTAFITESCDESKRDRAFDMLMTMWSWDGSMRIRYGEKGVNWVDPDPGAKSDMGLDATYKLLIDPLSIQSTAKWACIASTLNIYAELETAQTDENTDPWFAMRIAKAAESHRLFKEQEENFNDPTVKAPILTFTEEEKERTAIHATNVGDRRNKAQTEFCTGILDPNSDADWNEYLKQLNDLGLPIVMDYMQAGYDRGI
jgi:putative aldouronate transport system substrate-binding protein